MKFQRLSQRQLLSCTIAFVVGVSTTPVLAQPDDKPAQTKAAVAKPAKPTANAPDKSKSATTKPDKPKPAAKATGARPASRATRGVSSPSRSPLPRARPGMTLASATSAPTKASLAPTQILPTMSFSLVTPAAAAPSAAVPEPASPIIRAYAAPATPFAAAESSSTSAADVALVRQAIDLVRRGKVSEALAVQQTVGDPLAQKLIEWAILRSDEGSAGFDRLSAFVSANPSWPSIMTLRRRTESALWDERRDLSTVRAFFRTSKPITAKGRFALARVLLADGDSAGAAQLVRQAWREDVCSPQVERMVMDQLGDLLTRADHKARMDKRLYDEDVEGGMRMAALLGETELAIARARKAVAEKSSKAGALLDAVPAAARQDPGYIFSKTQWLRREDRIKEAGQLLLTVPRNAMLHDPDEWWVERKLVARKLLDEGDHRTAYRVAREAASPPKELYRGEHEFHRRLDRVALPRRPARRRTSISPVSGRERRIPPRSHAASTGRAAPPRRRATPARRARTTRPPRSTRPPITDRSRAPGSDSAKSSCAARRSRRTAPPWSISRWCARRSCSTRSTHATWSFRSCPTSPNARSTRARWSWSPRSPSETTMRVPCC
jgi:soluble lytic murein transglycosylase